MSQSTHHIIPEGERYCIWMDAGVVDYKLCNGGFLCETCAFDAQIRSENRFAGDASGAAVTSLREHARTNGAVPQQQTADAVRAADHPARVQASAARSDIDSSSSAEEHCEATLQSLLRSIGGQPLPDDRVYAPNHTWARREEDGSFALGVDHFIGTMLPGLQSVACTIVPTHIRANEPFAWIVANGETLAVRSPIAGRITASNPLLAERSAIIRSDPYRGGWIARIEPESDGAASALMTADAFQTSVDRDASKFERSIRSKVRQMQPPSGRTTMYDGGAALANFEDMLGTRKYYAVLEQFLRLKK